MRTLSFFTGKITKGKPKIAEQLQVETNGRKLKILHVVGSPTDEFRFRLNVFYASAFREELGAGKYEFTCTLVRPGGLCSFVERLSDVMDLETLEEKETDVKKIDVTNALQHIKTEVKPDIALLHLFCEKGQTIYRALFEALEIPIIGPAAAQCFITVDKLKTRKMIVGDANSKNIHCPEAVVYKNGDSLDLENVPYPCVVKASKGEDSMAVRLVKDPASFGSAFKHALSYSDTVIIERFIKGREFRCAVIESRAKETLWALIPQQYKIPEDDIRKTEDKLFLDKRGLPLGKAPSTQTSFLDPDTDEELIHRIQLSSFEAFRALDLRDFALFDFRVDSEGNPWFLECNLFCSFGPQSILNIHAKHAGISDEVMFDMVIQNALLRGK